MLLGFTNKESQTSSERLRRVFNSKVWKRLQYRTSPGAYKKFLREH